MVWLSCLILLLVSSALLYLTTKTEGEKSSGKDRLLHSMSDVIMLNVSAISMQGSVVELKGPSGRIITLFLSFSYMFLYVSYSGSIVALLQSSDTSITTFSDLLKSPLEVGADDVVYSQYYFKTETDPIRKALYDNKVARKGKPANFFPVEEGIARVRKGLFAFHVETSVGYSVVQKTFTEEEKCGLQEFRLSFIQNMDPLLMMRRNTPYREHLRIGMKKILERGLNFRELRRIYTKKPVCVAKGSRFVSVGLIDSYPAFMVLVYGSLFAVCILLLEKSIPRRLVRCRST